NRSRIEGDAEVHRLIRGDVARVVRVGNAGSTAGLVSKLICPVAVAKVEYCSRDEVPDPGRPRGICAGLARVVSQARQQGIKDRPAAAGKQINGGTVGRDADRLLLVRARPLVRRHTELAAE